MKVLVKLDWPFEIYGKYNQIRHFLHILFQRRSTQETDPGQIQEELQSDEQHQRRVETVPQEGLPGQGQEYKARPVHEGLQGLLRQGGGIGYIEIKQYLDLKTFWM